MPLYNNKQDECHWYGFKKIYRKERNRRGQILDNEINIGQKKKKKLGIWIIEKKELDRETKSNNYSRMV